MEFKLMEGKYYLIRDDKIVMTPMHSKVYTHHKELIELLQNDATKYGTDPTRTTSMVSLQFSYLDFAAKAAPEELQMYILSKYGDDIFFDRPADPQFMFFMMNCFGPIDQDPKNFGALAKNLYTLNRRQLLTIIVASANLGSAILGYKLIMGVLKPESVSIGLCPYIAEKMVQNEGMFMFGGTPSKYAPAFRDEAYCERCLQGKRVKIDQNCGIYNVLKSLIDFAKFPEEP